MIDALISQAINWFTVLVSLFPMANFDIVAQINEFMTAFRGAMAIAGIFFPVSILMWAMATIMTIEIALFSFKVWRWIVGNVSLGFLRS